MAESEAGFPWSAAAQPVQLAQRPPSDDFTSDKATSEKTLSDSPQTSNTFNSDTINSTKTRASTVSSHEGKPRHHSIHKPHIGSLRHHHDHHAKNKAKPNVRFQFEPVTQAKPAGRLPVRTIPAWIQDATEDDVIEAAALLDPDSPEAALIAQHNHSPYVREQLQKQEESRGRQRRANPTSSGRMRDEPTSRWISFARASAYPRENFNSEKVDKDWLDKNWTDYSVPYGYNPDDPEGSLSKHERFRKRKRTLMNRLNFAIMRNPFVPLFFRIFVFTFAVAAMALGAEIWRENQAIGRCLNQAAGQRDQYCNSLIGQDPVVYDQQDPSALMAIIVDVIAIIYTLYITYDEYFSKPLGLRPAAAKVRLVLLDLFFIIFQAANLSLAFNNLFVSAGPCRAGIPGSPYVRFNNVCDRAEALSSVLLISLVAWTFTFSVSVLRLVSRMNTR